MWAQDRPEIGPRSAQDRPKVGQKLAKVRPKIKEIVKKYRNLATGSPKPCPAGRGSVRIFARVCFLKISAQTEPRGPETAKIGRKNIENRVFGTSGYYL